ncbi:MAG: hypothetical protein HC887_10515 [Desulfobacteraceae bacterium]|nr:hypothetical protein [Desulfobacteraceae bacterium]
MSSNAVIQRKLEVFDTTLNKLRGYLPVSYEKLCEDWGLQKNCRAFSSDSGRNYD